MLIVLLILCCVLFGLAYADYCMIDNVAHFGRCFELEARRREMAQAAEAQLDPEDAFAIADPTQAGDRAPGIPEIPVIEPAERAGAGHLPSRRRRGAARLPPIAGQRWAPSNCSRLRRDASKPGSISRALR